MLTSKVATCGLLTELPSMKRSSNPACSILSIVQVAVVSVPYGSDCDGIIVIVAVESALSTVYV